MLHFCNRALFLLLRIGVVGISAGLTIACGEAPSSNTTSDVGVQTLAFPEAEGFGRFAKGGRGGRVIEVTNLNDSGTGSLRQCAEIESGPRTCVFRIAGTIVLDTVDILVRNPFLTIAGQTAPGGGVTLKDGGISILANDVIVRYLRVRPGPASLVQRQTSANGISIRSNEGVPPSNIIIDHCSISWGTDDLINVLFGADNVTLQWNILSEGLNCKIQGCGSRGLLLDFLGNRFLSVHHNLYAHIFNRFPEVLVGNLDMVNNVAFNSNATPVQVNPLRGPVHANFIGNYFKDGLDLVPANASFADIRLIGGLTFSSDSSVYVLGNIGRGRPIDSLPQEAIIWRDNGGLTIQSTRFDFPLGVTTDAFTARDQVLAGAGATLPVRDTVDQRIITDVMNGTGRIIADPSEVGGWPALASGTPPIDDDKDGMPDTWELSFGLNPSTPSDGPQDADGDGYTNLEEYLNSTNPLLKQ